MQNTGMEYTITQFKIPKTIYISWLIIFLAGCVNFYITAAREQDVIFITVLNLLGMAVSLVHYFVFEIFFKTNYKLRIFRFTFWFFPLMGAIFFGFYADRGDFLVTLMMVYLAFCIISSLTVLFLLQSNEFYLSILYNVFTFSKNQPQPPQFQETPRPHAHNIALGNGVTTLDNVIKSIISRAESSAKMTTTALFLMVIIVFIGGGASIGTIALSELNKVREMEQAKKDFVSMKSEIIKYGRSPTTYPNTVEIPALTDTSNASRSEFLSKTQRDINANYNQLLKSLNTTLNDTNYEKLINKIDTTHAISWEDIAMRATIAALTLFLVQVFFHIYKYNQQQSSFLFGKAEAIELCKTSEPAHAELKKAIIDKLETDVKFGKDPTSAIDQVINALEKIKKASG
jgi:hypothetical protein